MPTEWFYSKSGEQLGPVSSEQLKQLAHSGQLQPIDLVWKDGMGQWVEARKVKGLCSAQPMVSPQRPQNPPQPEATPPQWFFSNAGQQRGPVSTEQLKQLAASGRLQPTDLVWKDGMGQWAEAKNIEGLFPPPTRITRLPSLLPPDATAGPPPMPAAAPAGPAVSSSPQMPAHAPVFQPQSLAEPFATVESQPFDLLDSSSTNTPYRSPRSFKKQPRKKKSLPLWLRIVMIVCASMILLYGGLRGWMESGGGSGVTNIFDDPNVVLVKTGHLSAYPNVTIGKAVDAFLSDPRWEEVHGKDGNEYVNVRGGARFRNKPIRVCLQFHVDRKAGSFEVKACEFNDIPQNGLITAAVLSKMLGSTAPTIRNDATTGNHEDESVSTEGRKHDGGRGGRQTINVEQYKSELNKLVGLTKKEVANKLGKPDSIEEGGNHWFYKFDGQDEFGAVYRHIQINFDDSGRVWSTSLGQTDM